MVTNAGVRITLVFLIARSEGYFGPKIDQKTHQGNQNQVHGPTDSFLPRRNRRFLFECARWSLLTLRTRIKRLAHQTICFSKSMQMHDIVIGLFINRYEFGRPL